MSIEMPRPPGLIRRAGARFMRSEMARKAAGGALLGVIGAKIVVLDKYEHWKRGRERMREGVGIGPTKFAGLPRRRQQGILYYKRRQLGALEGVYGMQGGGRRRRGGVAFP